MGVLQRFERRLGGLVEGAFAKVFKGGVEPVEIASALARETDDRRAVSSNRVLVPNEFAVELATSDFTRLAPYTAQLCDELGEMVREHAGEQRYTFVGPVRVRLSEAPDLDVGVFRIRSSVAAAEPGVVGGRRPTASRSSRAGGPRLVVSHKSGGPGTGGGRECALDSEVTVIGRGERCDIRLNDTGVSRHHGEVRRLPDGAFLYVDNGSTNGSIVNGRRATEVKLVDGDRIELGAAVLTFRREDGPGAERARAARSAAAPPPADGFGPAQPGPPGRRPGYGGPRPAPRDDPRADPYGEPGRGRGPGYPDDDRYRGRPARDPAGPTDPYSPDRYASDPYASGPYDQQTVRPGAPRPPGRDGSSPYPAPPYRGTGQSGGTGTGRRPESTPGYDSGRDRAGRGGRSGGDPYGGYGGSGHAEPDVPGRGFPEDEGPAGRPGGRAWPAPPAADPAADEDELHDAQTYLPGRMPPPGRGGPDDRPRSRPDRSW